MSEQAEAITKFRDVTDVDEEQAKAYLEAANNNLQVIYSLVMLFTVRWG